MPWRLIGFIIISGIFLVFIAFNLGNRCDINVFFHTFKEVPVFLTAFASFVLGMFCAMPFIISFRTKRKNRAEAEKGAAAPVSSKRGKKNADAGLEARDFREGGDFPDGGSGGIN
jgi:uncharacterized integral membrane protein